VVIPLIHLRASRDKRNDLVRVTASGCRTKPGVGCSLDWARGGLRGHLAQPSDQQKKAYHGYPLQQAVSRHDVTSLRKTRETLDDLSRAADRP